MTRIRFAPALAAGLLTAGLAVGSAAAEQKSKNTSQSDYSQTNRFANPGAGAPAVNPSAGQLTEQPVERAVRRECVSQSLREFSRAGSGYIDNRALFTRDSFFTYQECVRRSGLR